MIHSEPSISSSFSSGLQVTSQKSATDLKSRQSLSPQQDEGYARRMLRMFGKKRAAAAAAGVGEQKQTIVLNSDEEESVEMMRLSAVPVATTTSEKETTV